MATVTEIRKEKERMEILRSVVKKYPKIDMGITNKNMGVGMEDFVFMMTTMDDLDEFRQKKKLYH